MSGTDELLVTRADAVGSPTALIDAEPWKSASWSPRFVDMASGRPALYDSRASAVATRSGLRVVWWSEDPYPSATQTERDSIVFADNDVELFLDFGWGYYEFEINAFGTVYEVMHVWRDTFADSPFAEDPSFSLLEPAVFTFGGDYDRRPASFWHGTHPRGVRIVNTAYDFPGLLTAVHVEGVLNDDAVTSRGWSAELLLPWAELTRLSGGAITAKGGWSVPAFIGRFQHLPIGNASHTAAWCLRSHGVMDTHQPEQFALLTCR
jgi:hypothetical protein